MSIQRIWTILLGVYAAALPFGPAIPNIIAAFVLGFAFWQLLRGKYSLGREEMRHFLLMNAFVIFLGVSIFWSQNFGNGLNKLLLILFIPLFFLALISSKNYINGKVLIRITELFVLSNCVLFIISLLLAVVKQGLSIEVLTENNLSTAFIDFHYLGFSLYVSVGLVLGLYIYITQRNFISKRILIIWPWCLILLGAALFLLSSRTTILVSLITVLSVIVLHRKQISKKSIVVILAVTLSGSITIMATNSVLKEKIKDAINFENQYDVKKYWGGRGFRELIWHCAYYNFKQHPILGSGFGDQQDDMELCYQKHRYQQLLFKGNVFNAHNIFLQILVAGGIVGLILFILAFVYPSFIAASNNSWVYFYFIMLVLGTGLTESHFNRNTIVSMFALFNSLLFVLALSKNNEGTSNTQ